MINYVKLYVYNLSSYHIIGRTEEPPQPSCKSFASILFLQSLLTLLDKRFFQIIILLYNQINYQWANIDYTLKISQK